MNHILVALSGGVDSAVAAALLARRSQGRTATAFIKTWMHEDGSNILADCPWERDLQDAQAIAQSLGLPFQVVDLTRQYHERVVQYLVEGYRQGITPNPDLYCNREIKFGVFLDYALQQGFDTVATGHYCQRLDLPDGTPTLLEGADPNKDQSYFLALLTPRQLRHASFPVGHLQKAEVRALAHAHHLPVADKKDSQGICFLGKVRIGDFLAQYIPDQPGDIVNTQGQRLGQHRGLHRYTLGQRKGLGIPSNTDHQNYVVVAKDYTTHRLTIAFDTPSTPGLWQQTVHLSAPNWLHPCPPTTATRLLARPRYRDPATPADFTPLPDGTATLRFHTPQRALAAGQLCALYCGTTLLGGAFYLHDSPDLLSRT